MSLRKWSRSEVEYGRKVLKSGLEGARSGRERFLNGKPLVGHVNESIRSAMQPAALGVCIGMLGACPGNRNRSVGRVVVFGLLGGAIGLGASFAWENRGLTASAALAASRSIGRVRDERWMQKNFIAYA
jgi:hypothetical protein